MKMLITGATGFIGSRLAALSESRGHEVCPVRSTLDDLAAVEDELKSAGGDVVVHLAWRGLPDIGPMMSAYNASMSIRFFECAYRVGVPRIIALGSAWELDQQEDADHRVFVEGKRAMRAFGHACASYYNRSFLWAIPFYVYGPGKKSESLIPSLIEAAAAGRVPQPKNPGAWHDFVYVDDVARALIELAEADAARDAYEIGTGQLTQAADIARLVATSFGQRVPAFPASAPEGRVADIRALTALGWKPNVSISEGVARTVAAFHG